MTFRPVLLLFACLFLLAAPATEVEAQDLTLEVVPATRVNTSRPLRTMAFAPGLHRDFLYVVPNKPHKFDTRAIAPTPPGFTDPVLDGGLPGFGGSASLGAVLGSFEGASNADNVAVIGGGVLPPDTNGDVGPNHYVQWINLVAEIFDKDGNSLVGPFAGNQFFDGLGGICETLNSGDPVVLYDQLADRWVVMQFAIASSIGGPYALCVAVSTTPDPTGAFHQYEFPFAHFPDYPKLGVWPDAYYATTVSFSSTTGQYRGAEAIALDRDRMLAGLPASGLLTLLPDSDDLLLPADLDGPVPPAGIPGLFAGLPFYAATVADREQIRLYEMDVDWVTPGNSTFTALPTVPTAAFGLLPAGRSIVPQPGTATRVDAIRDRLMHRLQYRNFGTHQTLVTNHTVNVGAASPNHRAGVRWYELRNAGAAWSMHQQGTFAPADGHHRWMGSIAMNGDGDLALGYSIASGTLFPSIRFTGQTATMSGTGVMDVPETEILAGTGSQTHSASRWGDYSMMSVDPSDDRTFWYTQQYVPTTSSAGWSTRVASLSLEPALVTAGPVDGAGDPVPEPVNVPGVGQTEILYAGAVTNNTGAPAMIDGWPVITMPDLSTIVRRRPTGYNLAAGASVDYSGAFNMLASFGPGTYDFAYNLGDHPSDIWTSDSFELLKAGPPPLTSAAEVGRAGSMAHQAQAALAASGDDEWVAVAAGADLAAVMGNASGVDAEAIRAHTETAPRRTAALGSAYPNPFNPVAVVPFTLPEAGAVRLSVYDVLGREVARLVDGRVEAGRHTAVFDASRLASGTYLVRFTAPDGGVQTQRLTLLN